MKVKVYKNQYKEKAVYFKDKKLMKGLKPGNKVSLFIDGYGVTCNVTKRGIYVPVEVVEDYGIPQPIKGGIDIFIDVERN